jgi:V/A-type H+-transporting ATPase subunit C
MAGDLSRYARVRAMLSTLLGRTGLEILAGYPSRQAVTDALLRTVYAPALTTGAGSDQSLLVRLAYVGRATLQMLDDPERTFVHLYLLRLEVHNLKVLVRAMSRRSGWAEVAVHVVALPGIGTIDCERLARADSLPEMVARLRGTPYGAAMSAALPRLADGGPFALEIALELDYYDRLWSSTANLHPHDTHEARRLLGILYDILNLNWIARYREALSLAPVETLNYTLRQGRWLSRRRRQALAEPGQPWDVVLARTPYAAAAQDRFGPSSTAILWRMLAAEARRMLAGYPFHIGIPLAFLLTQEIEIRDLSSLLAASDVGISTDAVVEHLSSVRR